MIVLDTNVISELMRETPDRWVFAWMEIQPPEQVFTTAVTKAEIYYGIEIKATGKKRIALQAFTDNIFGATFKGRILSFNSIAAEHFAKIAAWSKSQGRHMGDFDTQIAAIARAHKATLATRNIKDFEHCGIQLLDPWKHR